MHSGTSYGTEATPEVDSYSMGQIIATFKITCAALVARDDDGGITLIVGALYNQVGRNVPVCPLRMAGELLWHMIEGVSISGNIIIMFVLLIP